MSWKLFGNDIYDEDLCFCRDFTEVLVSVSKVTTSLVWHTAGRKIIEERNLQSKMEEYSNLSSRDKVHDCYPTNRKKLLANADSIMQFVYSIGLSRSQLIDLHIMLAVFAVLKKMSLQDSEKTYIIKKYILPEDEIEITATKDQLDIISQYDDILVERWKEMF